MAATASNTTITSPIAVVGRQYCISDKPVELVIVRKAMSLTMGNFTVTDLEDNIKFKVEAPFCSFHDRRILRDPTGNPIVTLRNKIPSIHDTCKVFRGESVEEKDLLFTAKSASYQPLHTTLKNIFLANNNTKQQVPDFRLEGSEKTGIYTFSAGDGKSKLILAQMYKKKNFILTINPNVDCAFIVSLLAVFNIAIKEDLSKLGKTYKASNTVIEILMTMRS